MLARSTEPSTMHFQGSTRPSDDEEDSGGTSGGQHDVGSVHALLCLREEARLVGLAVGLVAIVDHECSQRLHTIVDLVLPQLGALLSHVCVEPEGVLGAVPVPVVVDDPESVPKLGGVHLRIQCIASGAEERELGPVSTSVLLRRQILCKIGEQKVKNSRDY